MLTPSEASKMRLSLVFILLRFKYIEYLLLYIVTENFPRLRMIVWYFIVGFKKIYNYFLYI